MRDLPPPVPTRIPTHAPARPAMNSPVALISILALLTLSLATHAAEPVGEPREYKQVAGRSLKLFVIKPPAWQASDQRPAVVFFHGGGWTGGTPSQFNDQGEYLATRGLVAIQVQYRLLAGKTSEPPTACVHDAKSAMRWVRAHAAELGIDPQRIASAGGSAGGHLAAFVGLVNGLDDPQDDRAVSPKPNAMILFNPVFDNGPEGWGHARVGDRFKEFSPAHNINTGAPPAIVFLGSNDKLIPVKTVLDFQAAMKKSGARCDALIYEGQAHGFFNRGKSGDKYFSETLLATDKFLASLGWLTGPPTLQPPTKSPL